jgi:raffinose/stachyose/melibiose transport system substrate-binding protein
MKDRRRWGMNLRRTVLVIGCASALMGATFGVTAGQGDGQSLTIWNYEDANSAMGQAWAQAVEIFKAEHPEVAVTFEIRGFDATTNNAQVILTGNEVPDVMEFNKGNADTGRLASQGLLTPLTDVVEQYGWDEVLDTTSLNLLSRYSEAGVAGSGDWYGIPNYGEYVLWYYNRDYFDEHGLSVPTTRAELEQLLSGIKATGQTPISVAALEFPFIHVWWQNILADAPADWTANYQLFQGPVDWDAAYWIDGTTKTREWVEKGYVDPDITGVSHEDMGVNFLSGQYPLMTSGSWWYGRIADEAPFNWGTFPWPEQSKNLGSVGNLWVVPTNAKNKDLAYEFIDITLRPEVQNILASAGGLPVAGDPAAITDPQTQEFAAAFQTFATNDQLALYPDFPVPGFAEFQLAESQALANGSKSPQELVAGERDYYEEGKADLLGG